MAYSDLYKDSICTCCLGCNKLDLPSFKGIYPTTNKEQIPCSNFIECYTEEEKIEKLRE